MTDQPAPERPADWPAWITDIDDLIARAVNQHSDMVCGCDDDGSCYIGLLLDEFEVDEQGRVVAVDRPPTPDADTAAVIAAAHRVLMIRSTASYYKLNQALDSLEHHMRVLGRGAVGVPEDPT